MKMISTKREYVFPSVRKPREHANSSTANMAIKRMGYHGELVAHGLRALASTTLNEKGFRSDLIETSLAHVEKNDTRRAYNRAEYLEERREMMMWWSEHIAKSVI
jgi:integrase